MNIFLNSKKDFQVLAKFVFSEETNSSFFSGDAGEVYGTSVESGSSIILCGLGSRDALTTEILKDVVAALNKFCKKRELLDIELDLSQVKNISEREMIKSVAFGIFLSNYEFVTYKTEHKKKSTPNFYLKVTDVNSATQVLEEIHAISVGIFHTRDLVNEPSNVIYPATFAERVTNLFANTGVTVEVLDASELARRNMNGILFVGKGSSSAPLCIILRWNPVAGAEKIGLVGKGVTHDTGGYSLKPSASMIGMKTDMGGAATVVGCMHAVVQNNVQKNIVAVIPVCENMISGESSRVGDVYTAMNGKTVEVLNTDAEGRLILADALHHIVHNEKVSKVLDLATLTGAAVATFGYVYTPFFANDEALCAEFMGAFAKTGEKFWRLPLDEGYKDVLKSDIADYCNIGKERNAGTISAAMFLQEFVGKTPWIHVDIAGTASVKTPRSQTEVIGATGATIPTVYEWIKGK